MIKLESLTFGTDAEVFLKTLDGRPIPVCGLFGGTKDKPKPLAEIGPGYAVQEDNAAMEFNIPPTGSVSTFSGRVAHTLETLRHKLPKAISYDQVHSSLVFNDEYLEIPEMSIFGCDPDYNAFTLRANERPVPAQPGLRTAAAHVHIGWENPTDEDRLELIRLSDVFAVLPTIRTQTEADARRRRMYGRAGAFRPKPYGVEHRVLPNTWIFTDDHVRNTLRNYLKAIAALNAGIKVAAEDYVRVCAAINNPHNKLAVLLQELYSRKFEDAVGSEFSLAVFWRKFL